MKNTLDFLNELQYNNNKEWFDANKTTYKTIKVEFDRFVDQLIGGITEFDASVKGLTPKDCTYRIYRDARFSHNKDPYKTHMSAYVAPHGKKAGYAGYYFHVEPEETGLMGGNFLSGGLYLPEPKVLRSIRDEIYDNGPKFLASIDKAQGFTLNRESCLKRIPTGFPPESKYAEYLKLKDIYLEKHISQEFMLSDNVLEDTLKEFKLTSDLVKLLNRAVKYAHEEM